MKGNMGDVDRTIRMLLGIAALLAALFVTIQITDITNVVIIILLVFAAIMILTSIIGVSLLYIPFKISTKK